MSKVTLTIKDETVGGKIINEITIALEKEVITVKDLIQARVYAEVEKYNSTLPEYYRGLIQPTEAENTLNGFKVKHRKTIDAEQQFYAACSAFTRNGFFVLIDNKQAEDLEEEVLVTNSSHVSFVKLTPLVGG